MKTSGYYEQEYASKREVIDIATEIATEIVNNADEIEGKVLTFANLPLASSQTDKIWLVEQSSGVWLVNYKQAGLYKSDGTNWNLLDSTSDIVNTLNNKADKLTTITAGTGLAGGGDLSINRTISHSDTSSQADVTNSNGSVIQSITLDTFGHIQTISSTNLDTRYDGRYASLNGAYANPTWITSLNADKLIGTIPSNVLSGSTLYIGTTAIALNRASGNQALTGISSVQFTGATSGTATIQAPAIAGTTTFTLPATSGNLIGSGDVGSVSNTMLAGSIADSKLDTITTAGKVANSSTSATNLNTANAIVSRDASGNFSAGTIAASLSGNSTTATTLQTARTINGVLFNGSANITITANTPNALTIASPLSGGSFNGSSAISIGIQTASSLQSGALSSTDWNTFNNKQNAISLTTTGNNGASSFVSNVLNIPNYTLAGLGGLALTGGTLTGRLISTLANNTGTGQGQIYLNGATGNRIDFNTNGVAAPSFTTRSAGTKIVLYPNLGATTTDYAIGIEGSTLWCSISRTTDQFKWYAGTTSIATLSGSGVLTASSFVGSLNGNANTATTLQTARTINGVSFNGGADITITANTPNTLTIESPLSGGSFNGGTAVSIGIQTATSLQSGALSSTDWNTFNTAYNRSPTELSVTGTTTKTITLTKQDGTTLTANWSDLNTDAVTSVFGRSGAVSAAEGDYSLDLLGDVIITSPATDQLLKYNGTNWANWTANYLTLSSLSASSPLSYNNTTGQFSITQATTSNNGFLSSTDWNTFNNKIGASGGTLTGQLISTRANNAGTGQGQLYLNGATGNRIDFNTNGVAVPTFGTRSTGTKIVLYPLIGASSTDFAIGVEPGAIWQSVPSSSNQFRWYAGTTVIASLEGSGNLNLTTGQLISTRANNTSTGQGQIYLNGATGNRIDFNQSGVAAPSFTTRSVGTKIVLFPNLSDTATDYAIGIEGSTLWSSIPRTTDQFKWYAGTTNIATLFGTGSFRLNGGTFTCGASETDATNAALQIYSDGSNITIEARQGNNNGIKRNIALAKYGGGVGIGKDPFHALDVVGSIQLTGTLLSPQLTAGVTQTNFNTVKAPGLYHYDGGLSNTPPDNTLNYRSIEIGSSGRYTQIAFGWDTDRAFFRNQVNSNFNDWREFVTSQNRSQYTTGKTSASSGNGYCVYDNVAVLVGDNSGGKWVFVSAGTATNLNGVYSLNWSFANTTSGRTGYIVNLPLNTNQFMGQGGDNYTGPGQVIGIITDTNVNRVYRFTWQWVSNSYQNVIIERLH